MPTLTVTNGPRSGTELTFDGTIVIGRGATAQLSLHHPTVSRRHAELRRAGGGEWLLVDLQSGNGTYLNGRRIAEPTGLRDGDLLMLGDIVVRYSHRAEAAQVSREPVVSYVETGPNRKVLLTMSAEGPPPESLGGREARDATAALSRRLQLVHDLAEELSRTFDEAALLSRILEKLFEVLPQAERGVVLLYDGEKKNLHPRAARTRSGEPSEIGASRTLVKDAVEKRQGILIADVMGDQRFTGAESVYGLQLRSVICVPMIAYDEVYGVIQIDSSKPGRPFDEQDMALIVGIARQVALSLANVRLHQRLLEQELLERDLMLARKIQQRFLPRRTPTVQGYSFAVEYSPALAVGGDFYDFLDLADGRVGILVGDVSGKGVSAALYMAKVNSEVRYHSAGVTEPAEILQRVNAALAEDNEEGMFVTAAFVSLDTTTGEMAVSSAGHLPPLVRGADGRVMEMGSAGDSPLGIGSDASFQQQAYRLGPRDVVVLYTDGASEAASAEKELFGVERLKAAVQRAGSGAEAVKESVLAAVQRFAGDQSQSDDLTVLCFSRDR